MWTQHCSKYSIKHNKHCFSIVLVTVIIIWCWKYSLEVSLTVQTFTGSRKPVSDYFSCGLFPVNSKPLCQTYSYTWGIIQYTADSISRATFSDSWKICAKKKKNSAHTYKKNRKSCLVQLSSCVFNQTAIILILKKKKPLCNDSQ